VVWKNGNKLLLFAKRVWALVIEKIKSNVIPPTVSREELNSLKIE